MAETKNENSEKLQSFINKLNSDFKTDVTKNKDGALEFHFTEISKTGLVFEETDDAEAKEVREENKPTPSATEEKPEKEDKEENVPDLFSIAAAAGVLDDGEAPTLEAPKERDVNDEEFIIPDIFDLAEASERQENSGNEDYVSTIWKAYVPRFTDVTENRYHFADNSEGDKKAGERSVKVEEVSPVEGEDSKIKVEQMDGSTYVRRMDDPTAEVESIIPDAVVVNVNGEESEKRDTINVFKFGDEKEEVPPQPIDLGDEELQRKKISDLTGHKWDKKEDIAEPVSSSDDSEEQSPEIKIFSEAEQNLPRGELPKEPSPVKKKRTIEPDPIPEGLDDKPSGKAANDTTEYNSFSMRDLFKDKFLDSIMAVRIRMAVAILLGLLTMAFDIFERDICTFFGFSESVSAPALIESCLIVSLLLISLPETVSSIKNLFMGIITPELTSSLVGVSVLAYSISMSALAKERYPLFASVYAIMVINSVFATHCLQSANFAAFKLVAEKKTKHIIDKPLTRSLELENIALDGLVDEYKSRTARVFKTAFVSDFFKNTAKKYDNSRSNLLVIAISFGIAFVGALVMYLISGIEVALATFALVVSLSTPAFALLSRRLPFYNIEKKAVSEGSAVIGEKALRDYSSIDVVAFDDTEVFGPDDVTLKSASDRRSDYLDSMRKMASLFAALGGPLCRVFEGALNKKYPPAYDVLIEDDGAQGIVDGYLVMAGTAEYMHRHNVKIPVVNDYKVGSTKIIYAASDGEFFATFTVNYSFSEEFALMLSSMKEKGIVPLVYTRDFNITNDFMKFLTGGADVIRVMKKYSPYKEEPVYGKISSPMVTTGDKTASLDLILASKKYTHFESFIKVLELSACGVGAALAIAIALSLYNSMYSLPTVLLSVWQIGWTVALGFMSFKNFSLRKKDKNNAEK